MTAACCQAGSSSSPSMWMRGSSIRAGARVFLVCGVAGFVAATGCCAHATRQRINGAPKRASAAHTLARVIGVTLTEGDSLQQGESAMKRITYVLLLVLFTLPTFAQKSDAQKSDQWSPAEKAMGRSGDRQPDGAIKFSFPRSDLKISVTGTHIATGLALGGWVAFYGSADNAMAMGDLVLTEDELPKAMSKLLGTSVSVAAVHNHLQNEMPRVMYMHITGHGKATELAQTIASALAETAVPAAAAPAANNATLPVDQKKMERCIGSSGKAKPPLLSFSLPTTPPVTEHG